MNPAVGLVEPSPTSPAMSVEMPPPVGVPARRVSGAATPSPSEDGADGAMDDGDVEALRALKNAYMRFYRSIRSALVTHHYIF